MPGIPLNDETRRSTLAPQPECESRKIAALQDACGREQAPKPASRREKRMRRVVLLVVHYGSMAIDQG